MLVGPIQKRLEQIIHEVIDEQDWQVIELAIQPDHVHLFVRTNPSTLPSDVPRLIKGRSSRLLRQKARPFAEPAHSSPRIPTFSRRRAMWAVRQSNALLSDKAIFERRGFGDTGSTRPQAPNKERPFISRLERRELSGPY